MQSRCQRTNICRKDLERSLDVEKNLKLQEYDREARVRTIDLQWLALRKHRSTVMVSDRRKR